MPTSQEIIKYKNFLIDKFKEIEVVTNLNEWQYVRSYDVKDNHYEHKLHHNSLGYIDIKEEDKILIYNIKLLSLFRSVSRKDETKLTKHLFLMLLKQSGNPDLSYYEDDSTNLANVIRSGNIEVVKFLVENGVSISVENEFNIVTALLNEQYEIVQYLLETDKNIDKESLLNSTYLNADKKQFIKSYYLSIELDKDLHNKTNATAKNKI